MGLLLFTLELQLDLRNTISFFFGKDQAMADEEKPFEKTNLSALSVSTKQKKRRRSNFVRLTLLHFPL